jgi:lambda family phage portal protein
MRVIRRQPGRPAVQWGRRHLPASLTRGWRHRLERAAAAPNWAVALREIVMPLSEVGSFSDLGGMSGSGGDGIWKGNQTGRLDNDWISAPLDADAELRGSLRRLRARTQSLARNNPYVRRYLSLLATNVVGANGARMRPLVRRQDATLDRETNSYLRSSFGEWSRKCTVDGRMSFPRVQRLTIRSIGQDGEAFIRMWRGYPHNRFGFALEPIPADMIDEQLNREKGGGKPEIRMGIEVDDFGRPIGYYMKKRPGPTGGSIESSDRIPGDEMLHIYDVDRAWRTRGFPWMASVMYALRHVQGMSEAELVAARTAASKMGFFTEKGEIVSEEDTDGPADLMMDASPGVLEKLPPGWDFTAWDPNHPSAAFAEFMVTELQQIGVGLDSTYAGISGDLSKTSFASGRIGIYQERDVNRVSSALLEEGLDSPVYLNWLDWSVLNRAVRVPDYEWTILQEHTFRSRGYAYIDPLKDAEAYKILIALGLESRTNILDGLGREFEDTLEELGLENELADEYGVDITGLLAAAGSSTTSTSKEQDPNDPEKDPEDTGDGNRELVGVGAENGTNGNGRPHTNPARQQVLAALRAAQQRRARR